MKGLLLVLACILLAGVAFPGAAVQAEPAELALLPVDLALMGELNSAAPWQQGSLVGTSTGVYFYPGQADSPAVLQLPQAEGSSQPAALTAILTQEGRAYALSLPAGCIWEILWDGKALHLDAPRSFGTGAFLIENQQGLARTWVPQQVLLEGDTLCVLSRPMQELGGSVLMLVDLQTGTSEAFPQTAGQTIMHLSPYREGLLLALAHGGGTSRVVELDLEAGSQTPYAQLPADLRAGASALLYHPGEDALYIKSGNRLLRRSAEGSLKEAAFLNVEAGHFIRFGALSWLGADRFALAHPGGLFLGSLTGVSAQPLVLWNVDERDPAHLAAMGKLGQTPLRVVQLEIGATVHKLAEVLIGGLAEPDIFLVYADEMDLKRLMTKGYAMNLDHDAQLAAFAFGTYPQVQAQCIHEGQLYLLPIGLAHEGLSVNPSALLTLDQPVPAHALELVRLVEAWPGLSEHRDDLALFALGTPRDQLTDALWASWLADCARQGLAPSMEDPGFKSLLEAIDQAALTGWSRRQRSLEAVSLFPNSLDDALDLTRWTGALTREQSGLGPAAFASFPLPLAVAEGSPSVLPLRLMLLGINPHSNRKETALQYLRHYFEAMPAARRMLLRPDMNQPLSNPQLPLAIRQAEEALLAATAQLEQAAPDADVHGLKEAVKRAENLLAYWRSDPPMVSGDAIRLYRDMMEHAVVMSYQNTGGGAKDKLEQLLARFRADTIGIDELVREAEGALRLSGLEDE